MRKRILSGMRPTGPLHIGHLAGALDNWKRMQGEYDCYFMIADWHALMSEYEDPARIAEYTRDMMLDWQSCGIDPGASNVFVQSHIPEHLELAMTFALFVQLGRLERNPTYKEQLRELSGRNITTYAFLGYPVLQAADIALYKGDVVPVGADQLPHLELTREIVRKFNSLYGRAVFPEPQPKLTETPRLLGLDKRKMSKSYGNYIALRDDPDAIRKKVVAMITDPGRVKLKDKGRPAKCNVCSYYRIFAPPVEVKEVEHYCKNALKGCTDCKDRLADILIEHLRPVRDRRRWLQEDINGRVTERWTGCLERVRQEARDTMSRVKESLHLMRYIK